MDSYYSDYTETTYSTGDAAGAAATFILFIFLFALAMYVVMALCLMQIFKKAGVKPWIAWVPIYNNWKMLEIGGQQGFWAVLALIPVVNIVSAVFMYIAMYNIGLKLGKDASYVLLAIFLSPIWYILMALEKSPWNDALGAPSLAPETHAAAQATQPTATPPTPPTPPAAPQV